MKKTVRGDAKKGTPHIFYGWGILACAFALYGLIPTYVSYGIGIVTTRTVLANGWNESVVGLTSSINFGGLAIFSTLWSVAIKKQGTKKVILLALLVGLVGIFLHLFLPDNPLLYVLSFVLFSAMVAGCGTDGAPCLLNSWFSRRRALPIAILISSGSVGGFLFPVIVQALCDREIRLAWWLFLAFTLFCIAITVLFVRNTPEEKGEVVDGLSWSACHPLRRLDTECAPAEQTHVPTVKECYTSFPFYSLSFQLFASRSMLAAFTSYIVLYAMNSGISASSAALLISVFNGVGLFGRLFSGTIDYLHIPKRVYAAVCHMFSCSGMLLLFLARTTPAFILAAALSGLGFGMLSALFVILQSACFGRENFPLVNGTFNSLGFIGAAVSPMLVAAIMHLTGSYGNAYLVISVICLIAFLLAAATPIRLIGSRQTQTDKRRSST